MCLERAGFRNIKLFEKATELSEVGAGIQIGPNGARLLQQLGLREAIERWAVRTPGGSMMDGVSGSEICSYPLDDWAVERFGFPFYQLHRADLQAVLAQALEQRLPGVVELGNPVVSVEQGDSNPQLVVSHGEARQADLVIGADGIHSAVRKACFDKADASFTGRVAWRAVVPADAVADSERGSARIWIGPGRHLVQYPVRRGGLLNLVACVDTSVVVPERWHGTSDVEPLKRAFEGWCPRVQQLVGAMNGALCWGLYERPPLQHMVYNRVALLGDSAHAMLPSMAQGAVMAMEDAATLAGRLAAATDVKSALLGYEADRQARNTRVQETARQNMVFFHRRSGLSGDFQLSILGRAGDMAETLIGKRYAWVYGFNAGAALESVTG